jgi:uncharacterized protein (UPF0147 family)
MEERVKNIVDALEELVGDGSVPRNIKAKVESIMTILKSDDGEDMNIKINKALSELDEISDDSNLQPYTRTQIWNIVSMLEMV